MEQKRLANEDFRLTLPIDAASIRRCECGTLREALDAAPRHLDARR
jgi:hypothetical protein